ncbi:MAG: hypothetical protein JJT75_06275 [Opitutales bacterium]|nr:hypothetical protein [Opitutales bacterium]MCH8539585.1 hypothetical protein [Opitutales bacterium]
MKFYKKVSLLAFLIAALTAAGCSTNKGGNDERHTLVLGGLYESKQAAYEAVPPTTLHISSDEYSTKPQKSGNYRSFFWGLITHTDY